MLKTEGYAAAARVESARGQIPKPRRRWWRQQYVQVIIGAVLGVLVGWLAPAYATALKPLSSA